MFAWKYEISASNSRNRLRRARAEGGDPEITDGVAVGLISPGEVKIPRAFSKPLHEIGGKTSAEHRVPAAKPEDVPAGQHLAGVCHGFAREDRGAGRQCPIAHLVEELEIGRLIGIAGDGCHGSSRAKRAGHGAHVGERHSKLRPRESVGGDLTGAVPDDDARRVAQLNGARNRTLRPLREHTRGVAARRKRAAPAAEL